MTTVESKYKGGRISFQRLYTAYINDDGQKIKNSIGITGVYQWTLTAVCSTH